LLGEWEFVRGKNQTLNLLVIFQYLNQFKLCVFFVLDNENNTLVHLSCVKAKLLCRYVLFWVKFFHRLFIFMYIFPSTLQNSSQQDLFLFLFVYLNCVSILCWTMNIIICSLVVRKSKVSLPIYVFILGPFLQFPLYFHVHFLSFPLQNSSQYLLIFLFVYLNCVYFVLDNDDNTWFTHRA